MAAKRPTIRAHTKHRCAFYHNHLHSCHINQHVSSKLITDKENGYMFRLVLAVHKPNPHIHVQIYCM